LSVIGVVIYTAVAPAQGVMTAQQQQVIRTTLEPDGYLTEREHRQFWSPIKARIKTASDMAAFRKALDLDVGSSIQFQREVWKSIESSQRAGKVTKTPEYEQAKSAMLSTGISPKESLSGIDEAERMFVAVANKTVYQSKSGPMYLNEDRVQKVLSGLESTVCRLRRLTDPEWSTKKQEFRYPNARLKMLSECPLPIEVAEVTAENGVKVKMVTLSVTISENELAMVSYTPLARKLPDPDGSLIRAANISLRNFGIQGARPLVLEWRGMKAASASASFKLPTGSINAAVRVVEGKKAPGMWTLLGGSQESLPNAESALAELEQNIMLD
jgi:hypothetical protein